MHSGRLHTSPRLQRVHDLLSDGREHSTLEIARHAMVCAVNSCVSELRDNGAEIDCWQIVSEAGQRIFLYRMARPAPRRSAPSIPPMPTADEATAIVPALRQHELPLPPAGAPEGRPLNHGAPSGITFDGDYLCDICGRAYGDPLSQCGCGLSYCDECGDADWCERCAREPHDETGSPA